MVVRHSKQCSERVLGRQTFVEDDFVPENLDFDRTPRALDETCQDLSHRFGASFDVHRTNANNDRFGRRVIGLVRISQRRDNSLER
jgi:hypothetical protein